MFNQDELKKKIEDTLNLGDVKIPDNHTVAFVTNFTGSGIQSAVAVKIKDNWKVSGEVTFHPTEGDWDYGVNVRWSK